jgi:hypothetical protein
MESFTTVATIGKSFFEKEKKEAHNMNHDMTSCHEYHSFVSCHDMSFNQNISKDDYKFLVSVLDSWRVFYPKAQIKKFGAKNCYEAMQRTKAFNPRVPGAYFLTIVRDIVNNADSKMKELREQQPAAQKQEINKGTNCTPIEEKPAVRENRTTEKTEVSLEATTMPENESKKQKGKITLPNITKWQEAREFLFKLNEYDMTNDNVVEFVKKIKRQYNFA